jgi:hypothetical protein
MITMFPTETNIDSKIESKLLALCENYPQDKLKNIDDNV